MTREGNQNRLRHEKSPYLLQHAKNPVDWYPWGDAAFEKAKNEDKPILVSIGYSTCHWCHVMADESFSDPDTAEIMNRHYVNIKVDREERPDLDNIYISAVSAMTGSAGWPLNVFLTPDGRPFYGGTYFPPVRRVNPSWKEILTGVADAYKDPQKREELLRSADNITRVLRDNLEGGKAGGGVIKPGPETLASAVDAISGMYEKKYGGFGSAPKFPMPPLLHYLLFYTRFAAHLKIESEQRESALDIASLTLEKMADGGIYDHLGGGFHRYSTDMQWHVPHFEKMLYDNAQLIRLYIDAYEATNNPGFADVAKETLAYILRDMTHPEGVFYSAEDADSVYVDLAGDQEERDPGEKKAEGGFYVWRYDEVKSILGTRYDSEVFEIFASHYDLNAGGNVEKDPLAEFTGKNVIRRVHTIEETAARFGLGEGEVKQLLSDMKATLFAERNRRPRPHLDDKILVEWNGLMISALATAYRVFRDRQYLLAADAALSFIHDQMYEKGDPPRMYRRWRDGERKINAMAADYAFLIQGLIDICEADFDPGRFSWAIELADQMLELFYDEAGGGFFTTDAKHDRHLLLRAKDATDNVTPSVDGVAVMNFIRLYRLTGNRRYREAVDQTLRSALDRVENQPSAVPTMTAAAGVDMLKHAETIILGKADTAEAMAVINVLRSYPREVVFPVWVVDQPGKDLLSKHMPHVKDMNNPDDKPLVFVCFDRMCREPVSDPLKLADLLDTAFESPLVNE
jgi:uncharacterized protein